MMERSAQLPAIVLVDDDPLTLALLTHTLRILAPAYELLAVSDAPSALTHLARRAVPLLITDYLLRGMDGLALTDAVKAASRSTYVVLMTMDDSLGLAAQARAHQVDRLLIKWDVFTELEDVVRTVLPIAPTGA